MGWSIGYDNNWRRHIGYGVPAWCDHPECDAKIDRGLSHVCGGPHPYGEPHGCGLYFCGKHLTLTRRGGADPYFVDLCPRCVAYRRTPYARPKPDHPEWIRHQLTDPTWKAWRDENPRQVAEMRCALLYGAIDADVIARTMGRIRSAIER